MLALPYDHCLVPLLFLDVPITVIVPSLLLTSFLNVFNYLIYYIYYIDYTGIYCNLYILYIAIINRDSSTLVDC